MSMLKYALHDFIATVPSCVQTTSISVVLEIFSLGQCDRLVVVSEQQCPIGVLYPARLMPHLMRAYGCEGSLDGNLPLSAVGLALVEPIVTLPAELSVEQFGFYLRSQQSQTNTGLDWALVDPAGKFLGLLDSPRLLQFLAIQSPSGIAATNQLKRGVGSPSPWHRVDIQGVELLVQLLERLPLPLMLQTSAGETVTQNPAWQRQIGTVSDPDKVRQEVAAILKVSQPPQAGVCCQATNGKAGREPLLLFSENANPQPLTSAADSASRCQLGTQPDTCICVWQLQNGQERVWQFVKIPLISIPDRDSYRTTAPTIDTIPHSVRGGVRRSNENRYNLPLSTDLWLVLAQDVTEQQQLASELAAKNADLIQLNRLKDEFLACISHELKTPLTAVLGLSTLLKNQALGELNERQARYARLIHQSGRHLMTVVNDILDLTRMETGQLELTLEPVQIGIVCDRAIEQARAIQPKTSQPYTAGEPLPESPGDHRFTLLIEPGLDSLVADELRLRQMLIHLLCNAFKFTEAGGEIGVRVNRWSGWIAFTVWDTGIGIPEQKQHLIFQKFQQLENPLTRQFEGTGLGLVFTRALARLHGGDVTFLSKEGKGSEFTLLLPPSPPYKRAGEQGSRGAGEQGSNLPPRPKSAPIPTPQKHRNRLVLVVEAAPRFIEDLTEQLTGLGYRVVIARSGTEALEKARRLQPGAVFLNPLLPQLSGWDLLTLLKSNAATRHIPVIVTATRADKEQAFANRADEFLSLPVQQQELQQIMARFCAIIPVYKSGKGVSQSARSDTPLTILRLVTPDSCTGGFEQFICPTTGSSRRQRPTTPDSSLLNHRLLEADDLEQAELLAQFWQPDVILIDKAIPDPLDYLKQLSQRPSLKGIPLVTLDAATTQAANQVTGLSVFPCLTPADHDTNALLTVLQIAAGMSWTPSLLVVDVATLPDLQFPSPASDPHPSKRSEWFQALIQYLQTAGFRGMMARSWAEVLQQIRQQSVDLLLICLGESKLHQGVVAALTALGQQPSVPPVLVMDQRLSQGEVKKEFHHYLEEPATDEPKEVRAPYAVPLQSNAVESLETVLKAIATQILPSSLSMEELLDHIHHTLPQTRSV